MDVWPDGFVQELCYGIVRARYRESFTSPSLIEPGRTYEYNDTGQPDGQPVQAGAPDPAGRVEQRLPELRPQPQYRGRRLRRDHAGDRAADDLPRPAASVARGAAGHPLEATAKGTSGRARGDAAISRRPSSGKSWSCPVMPSSATPFPMSDDSHTPGEDFEEIPLGGSELSAEDGSQSLA